ncbi:MAG: 30S ribosomal protein S18 [Deltaproteobacteria bacterium]|nr:30S ribosomal protein S18 [Deltaproteobacteria bacterium]
MVRKIKKREKRERRRSTGKRKNCRFCIDKEMAIDYKLVRQLGGFLSERGKLAPKRISGNCAYHQRRVVEAVKRARILALLPYTAAHAVAA